MKGEQRGLAVNQPLYIG